MGRLVKFRLVTYFEEAENPVDPNGGSVLVEKIASMGDEIDLREQDEKRLDDLGALYTEEEQKAIEDGTYSGEDAAQLANFRAGFSPPVSIEPAEGETGNFESMSSSQVADYIKDNNLTVDATLGLLPDNPTADDLHKLYDAETEATDNEPRSGVTKKLDTMLASAS